MGMHCHNPVNQEEGEDPSFPNFPGTEMSDARGTASPFARHPQRYLNTGGQGPDTTATTSLCGWMDG